MAEEIYSLDGGENDGEYELGEEGKHFYAKIEEVLRKGDSLFSVRFNVKRSAFPGFDSHKPWGISIRAKHYAQIFGEAEPKEGEVVRGNAFTLLNLIGKNHSTERDRIYQTRIQSEALDDSGEYRTTASMDEISDEELFRLADEEEKEDRRKA